MKILAIIITLFTSAAITAQEQLDTIYANDKKNVALFFPKPIHQGITGTSNFVFTYNREKEQYFGLLQALPGVESNLLTITNEGKVYSYILKYKERLSKLNYFIAEQESIGNQIPKEIKVRIPQNLESNQKNRSTYFNKLSEDVLNSKMHHKKTKRKKGIKLQLQNIVYHDSEVYLVMTVENNSKIDFEVDYLNIYRTNGNKKRKASYQKLQLEVLGKYKFRKMIKKEQSGQFVYILTKFVLTNNEKLQIELQELKGSRSVVLETVF